MIHVMKKGVIIRKLVFLCLVFISLLHSEVIDVDQTGISILKHSDVYLDQDDQTLTEIISQGLFQPYHHDFVSIGVSKKKVWIKLDLRNKTDQVQEKILLFGTPFIEHIHLYREGDLSRPDVKGQAHPRDDHRTQLHYYKIRLEPHTAKTYYVTVFSKYSYLNFNLGG